MNIKIYKHVSFIGVLLLVLLSFGGISIAANGPAAAIRLTPSKTSITTGQSVSVEVYSFFYVCNHGSLSSSIEECDYLTPPGYSGSTQSRADETTFISADSGATVSVSSVTTNSSGLSSFTVTSNTAGTYNVYAKTGSGFVSAKKAITFSAPSSAPTTSQKPINSTTSNENKVEKPTIPTVVLVNDEGEELKPKEGEEKVVYNESEPIVLSGTTVPNGQVKLYIFSTPQEAEVTADENGAWSYTIASIEPGDHRVEAEVTNPATGQTSDRAEVQAFTVAQTNTTNKEATTTQDGAKPAEDGTGLLLPIALVVAVLAVAGAGLWWWKKRYNKQASHTLSNTTNSESNEANDDTDIEPEKNEG